MLEGIDDIVLLKGRVGIAIIQRRKQSTRRKRHGTVAVYGEEKSFWIFGGEPDRTRNSGTGKGLRKAAGMHRHCAGETVTLAEAEGSGMVTHIWFTGYTGHSFVMRCYWDGCEKSLPWKRRSARFSGDAYDEQFADRDGKYPAYSSAMMTIAPARGLNCNFRCRSARGCASRWRTAARRKKTLYYMISAGMARYRRTQCTSTRLIGREHPVTPGRAYSAGRRGGGADALGLTLAVGLNGHNTCFVERRGQRCIWMATTIPMNYTGTERIISAGVCVRQRP